MSHEFYVGQKVVCVDDAFRDKNWVYVPNKPKKGEIYTVRKIGFLSYPTDPDVPSLWLNEVFNEPQSWAGEIGLLEWGFWVARFRPLEERPDSIEQFRAIARGVSDGKPIVEDAEYRLPKPEKVKAVEWKVVDCRWIK